MAAEPITIYSFKIDPHGVLTVLRTLEPSLQVIGPEDNWERIIITGPRTVLGKSSSLIITHDEPFYDAPGWSRHLLGMQGYFSRFPETNRKPGILQAIGNLGFILGTIAEPEIDLDSSDERSRFVIAIAKQVDGLIFSPSALRDAKGRVLIAHDGSSDADAVLPQYPILINMEGAEETELEPPSRKRTAARTLALAAVSARGLLEGNCCATEKHETDRREILSWIESVGIGDELEPDEWKILQRPVGSLDGQAAVDASWRVEGLAVLAWALQRAELPPYDQQIEPVKLYAGLGCWDEKAGKEFLAFSRSRPVEELRDFQTVILAVHWRLRQLGLDRRAIDFRKFSREGWMAPFDLEPFRLIDGDLAIGDYTVSKAPKELLQIAMSCACERHLAINWIMGYSQIYSETDTST
jgi:Domain of unknown function (DUF4272)